MKNTENGEMNHSEYRTPKPLRVTDPAVNWNLDDGIINAVIATAVWSEKQRPGLWQRMINALNRGAGKTEEGTVNAFLFQAMVDRLLEEYHAPDSN